MAAPGAGGAGGGRVRAAGWVEVGVAVDPCEQSPRGGAPAPVAEGA